MSGESGSGSIGSRPSDVGPIETELSKIGTGSKQPGESPADGSEVGSSGLPEKPNLERPGEGSPDRPADGASASSQEVTPENCRSTLRPNDLEDLRRDFQIPEEYSLELPSSSDRMCRPPPDRLAFHRESFLEGLRLPLHPFFLLFCRMTHLPPYCLAPNAWQAICGFCILCFWVGVPPSMAVFRWFFSIGKLRKHEGWWCINPRKSRGRLLCEFPTSHHF